MPIVGALYDSTTLLVQGPCTLSPATQPTHGSIEVGVTPRLLNYRYLTLKLPTGDVLSVVPRRLEHSAGVPTILQFDVER
jgi:hypothetical protein